MSSAATQSQRRERVRIVGLVQGVGFRPFVHRLAHECRLTGFVGNDAAGVFAELQGSENSLDRFFARLPGELPKLARIDTMRRQQVDPQAQESTFRITSSNRAGIARAAIAPDAATCADCRREILDPENRRHRHALSNCTHCGPRFSIVRSIPYDRANTSMANFALCAACRAEYENPADRRFHAQPTACPNCGPSLELVSPQGRTWAGDPLDQAVARLVIGEILAIKGVGGYHLACRADDTAAIDRLRAHKQREAKPLALMVGSVAAAERIVTLSPEGLRLLHSSAAPIVLAPRKPGAPISDAVAPGNHRLGVMLAYTPLHHLLFAHAAAVYPALVMTSGNRSEEPLAIDDIDALDRLGPICDAILRHDRPIVRAVEDSLWLDRGRLHLLPLRRSRGYVPAGIPLRSMAQSDGIAVGGDMKATVAILRDGEAICGPHLGDRQHPLSEAHTRRSLHDLLELLQPKPRWIAHDLHPLYESTRQAQELAKSLELPLIGVQHHHAHAASVLAEHGEAGPVLAIVCDGTGYGEDGTVWGGELLQCDLHQATRLGHLRALPLLGGDAAARSPRRVGLALLQLAYGAECGEHFLAQRLYPDDSERELHLAALQRGLRCVPSTGAGRWFDGFAALLGLARHNRFEAEAALALEAAALRGSDHESERWIQVDPVALTLDPLPLVRHFSQRLRSGARVEDLARLFHVDFAAAWAEAARLAAERTHLETVVLSGGVMVNEFFVRELRQRLEHADLRVLEHRIVPPNDGGLALGQLAVAATRFRQEP